MIITQPFWRNKCTTMDNTLVAHYDLEKEHTERMYEASGHNLMVFEDYAQLAIGEYTLSFFFFSLKFLLTQFYSTQKSLRRSS